MKVLYFAAWYPSKLDAMAGLFVQKHAIAVAKEGVNVCVLYFQLTPKSKMPLGKGPVVLTDESYSVGKGMVREIIVYYTGWKFTMLRAMIKGCLYTKKHWGMPDVVQVNTIDKGAYVARMLNWLHHIPYVMVEHWSAFLPENGVVSRWSWLRRWAVKHVFHHASVVMPVSQYLQNAMYVLSGYKGRVERIENVVGEAFFVKDKSQSIVAQKFRFLHVSCFDERPKNVSGILRATKALSLQRQDFLLTLIGTGPDFDEVKNLAEELQFPKGMITFTGEQTSNQVADAMREYDAFVLFSRYETAGVVLAESLVSGLPIIGTNVGGIPEMVNEKTGILVPSCDETALAQAMAYMIDNRSQYDVHAISQFGERYKEKRVGEKLVRIYHDVLTENSAH